MKFKKSGKNAPILKAMERNDIEECPFCHGSGRIGGHTCVMCGGSGLDIDPDEDTLRDDDEAYQDRFDK